MAHPIKTLALAALASAALISCSGAASVQNGDNSSLPAAKGYGPDPALPAPETSLIPTVNIAPASKWEDGKTPIAAKGFEVASFANGLDHPRWLYVLPNGDVLVAETNKPEKPPEGIKGWVMGKVQSVAGAGVKSPDRITLLRDADGDGVPETRTIFLQGLHSPFGMALIGNDFYVADTDAILKFSYKPGETQIVGKGEKVTDLPAGPINHHWTKNIIASPDGKKLYATVGSNSNVAENGMAAEGTPRRHPGSRPAERQEPGVRRWLAQPERLGLAAQVWRPLDGRERAGRDR